MQTINGTAVTSARSSGQNQTMNGGMTATRDQLRLALNQLLNELIANYPDAIRRTYASPARRCPSGICRSRSRSICPVGYSVLGPSRRGSVTSSISTV